MKTHLTLLYGLACSATLLVTQAQQTEGPYPPNEWPGSSDPTKVVHFVAVGDFLQPLSENWITGNMNILSGGDQNTEPVTIGGSEGVKTTANYLNTADMDFTAWAEEEEIDILMQLYGDGTLFQASGQPRNYNFLIGTLPELDAPIGGQVPVEARNRKWNWVLFRIPNTIRPSDGTRRVGSIPANAQGATQAGGVNGGTIRLENVSGIKVRAIAFGQKGAFGEPAQVNKFAPADPCPAEPNTNLAWIDINNNQNDHMQVLNDKDQTVTIDSNIGPAADKRRAVRPNGAYMNFGVTDNYLGAPCNDARAVKICVEFYDDPALAGKRFGPDAFATDDQGSVAFVAEDKRRTLTGSGKWERHSWIIPGVSLYGVNVSPLTAGPRLFFEDNAPIYISKFDLSVQRIGTHPLAGQDPLDDCFDDPNFCTGAYGNYAEMDLARNVLDGLAPGTSGGDQEMIQAEAGPTTDRRMAIRPARDDGSPNSPHSYLNFAITDEKLGPNSQPGVTLAICVTYYDDPALVGKTFRPEVYISDAGGNVGLLFTPANISMPLEGTDTWRDAYFELNNVKFNGVNQGPQAAARFHLTDKIFFSRVRYGVIRPCGPQANVNPLAECKPVLVSLTASRNTSGTIRISWPAAAEGFVLEQNATVDNPDGWVPVAGTPTTEGNIKYIDVTPSGTQFYRLTK